MTYYMPEKIADSQNVILSKHEIITFNAAIYLARYYNLVIAGQGVGSNKLYYLLLPYRIEVNV